MALKTAQILSRSITTKFIKIINLDRKNFKDKYSGNFDCPQYIMILALYYSLLKRDIALSYILLDMLSRTDMEEYTYACYNFWNDFLFEKCDVDAVLLFGNQIYGKLNLSQKVLDIFFYEYKYHNFNLEIISSRYAILYYKSKEERITVGKKDKSIQNWNQLLVELLIRPILTKILRAVEHVNIFYSHKINKCSVDTTPEQDMIITLFYSFLKRDRDLCLIILDMLSKTEEDCTLLFLWLKFHFKIDNDDLIGIELFARRLEKLVYLPYRFENISWCLRNSITLEDIQCSNCLIKERERRFTPNNVLLQRDIAKESARSKRKRTPLHVAATLGDAAAVDLLAHHYQSLEPRDCNDRTPLHQAVNCLHFETVRVLLEHGANTEVKDYEGLTPLDLARRMKSEAMLKIFQKYTDATAKSLHTTKPTSNQIYDINRKDSDGRTALHILAGFGMAEEVGRLLQLGADPHLRDKKGRTPFDHAVYTRDTTTISLLSSLRKRNQDLAEHK